MPSWPLTLSPQHTTLPSFRTAHACDSPAEIATAVVSPVTATGVGWSCLAPLPSCPPSPLPQHATLPFVRSAHEKLAPHAMPTASFRLLTSAGIVTRAPLVSPLPTCPSLFSPQHETLPEVRTAHVWYCPAATCRASAHPDGLRRDEEASVFSVRGAGLIVVVVAPALDDAGGRARARVLQPERDLEHVRPRWRPAAIPDDGHVLVDDARVLDVRVRCVRLAEPDVLDPDQARARHQRERVREHDHTHVEHDADRARAEHQKLPRLASPSRRQGRARGPSPGSTPPSARIAAR